MQNDSEVPVEECGKCWSDLCDGKIEHNYTISFSESKMSCNTQNRAIPAVCLQPARETTEN